MSLESASWINQLVATNPEGTDPKSQGDDHLRMIKAVLKNQFPAFTGQPVTKTEAQLNAGLIAGSFGLGGVAVNITEAQFQAADLPTGFYHVTPGGLGHLPTQTFYYCINIDQESPTWAGRIVVNSIVGTVYAQIKNAGVWLAWRQLWDSVDTPKQTTPLDTTPAAILNPGSFGLGSTLSAGTNADLNSTPIVKVPYNVKYKGNSWVNPPPGVPVDFYGVSEWISFDHLFGFQYFHYLYGVFYRCWGGGVFSAWTKLNTTKLSSGNGYQITDGIVEQWGNAAAIADDATAVITFPQPMTECFTVVANPSRWVSGTEFNCLSVISFTGNNFTCGFSSNGTAVNSGAVRWMAKGRL